MVNYQDGKIYKLCVKNTEEILYVGSTCAKLCVRIAGHRNDCKRKNSPLYKYIKETCGIENVQIVLISNFSCNSKEELLAEERKQSELIGFDNLQNMRVEGRTPEEYRKDNKEKIKEKKKKYRELNKDKTKEYYEKNKDKIVEKSKQYYEDNKEQIKERITEYYKDNKEKINERQKKYAEKNKEKINEKKKKYYEDNKEKINERQKKYAEKNKEKIRERQKKYYLNNKEKFNKK